MIKFEVILRKDDVNQSVVLFHLTATTSVGF